MIFMGPASMIELWQGWLIPEKCTRDYRAQALRLISGELNRGSVGVNFMGVRNEAGSGNFD